MNRWNPIITLLACPFSFSSFATHMRGGYISVEQQKGRLTCKITITAYIDTESPVPFGGSITDALYIRSAGQAPIVYQIPEITRNAAPPPGGSYKVVNEVLHIAVAEYVIYHTFTTYGQYFLSYQEINRNAGILNMTKSVDTPFYVESSFVLDPSYTYSTPKISAPAVFFFSSEGLSLSLGAEDSMNNTLYYKLRTPMSSFRRDVLDYFIPGNMKINEYNGLLTWDGKINDHQIEGEIAVAAHVYQYHNGKKIGFMIYDFQVIAGEDQDPPSLTVKRTMDENNSVRLSATEETSMKIIAEYNEIQGKPTVGLYAYSEMTDLPENFNFSTYDSTSNIKVGILTLKNTEAIHRDNPYHVTIRAALGSSSERFREKDVSLLVYTNNAVLPPPPSSVDENVYPQPEEPSNTIKAYPNPSNDYVIIEPAGSGAMLTIYSAAGVKMNIPIEGDVLRMETLPPGVYLLHAVSGNFNKTTRIIKQ